MSFSELFANLKPGFYISGKRQILNKVLNLTVISVNRTIIIDGGSRPKNIVILVKFWYGVLIWTSDHHVCFVCRKGFPDSLTQPQLIRGASPSKQKLKDNVRLT